MTMQRKVLENVKTNDYSSKGTVHIFAIMSNFGSSFVSWNIHTFSQLQKFEKILQVVY